MTFRSAFLALLLFLVTPLLYPGSQSMEPDLQAAAFKNGSLQHTRQIYESLIDTSLKAEVFFLAMKGYRTLVAQNQVEKDSLLTIIDYSLPSSCERFFVINLARKCLVYKTLVAHGRNSGELYALRFSNKVRSHQSALGFYITGDPYVGGQGYSMILNGIDTGYNDQARLRAIVIHGADYATENYIKQYGRLGRSFGCPALPPDVNHEIIDLIKEGSVVFGFYPDSNYLEHSVLLGYQPEDRILSASQL
jgi:hypothetical protein